MSVDDDNENESETTSTDTKDASGAVVTSHKSSSKPQSGPKIDAN